MATTAEPSRLRWLGSKYLSVARVVSQEGMASRAQYLMAPLGAIIQTSLLAYFWSAVYASATSMPDTNLLQLVTYVCVGQAINSCYVLGAEREIADRIVQGDVALDLVKPLDFQAARLWEAVGATLAKGVPITAVVLLFSWLAFGITAPASGMLVVFGVSLVLSFLTNFAVGYIIQLCAFYMSGYVAGLTRSRRAIVDLFSGALIPLWLFPDWFEGVARALPFKGIIDTPLSIYVGRVPPEQVPGLLWPQLVWALVLLALGRVWWAVTSRRITIYGG